MSAQITINFGGGTATSSRVAIVQTDATISPNPQTGVSVAMASALTNITVLSNQVAIATALNAAFDGSLTLSIAWSSGDPAVTLDNLQSSANSPATATWPTAAGPQTQILTPGNPLTLSGLVSS